MIDLSRPTLLLPALAALAPTPELGFLLQTMGVGGAIGSALALRVRHRHPDADTWTITTAWALLGLAVGVVLLVVPAVV